MVQIKNFFTKNKSAFIYFLLLMIWIDLVGFAIFNHEYFRDEVRDLSLAKNVISPVDLFFNTQNEGHPFLWYFLLFIAKSIFASNLVLPGITFLTAFLAISIFLMYAPFNIWLKCLFVFSALSVYEYSVIARPYGISMLFLFLIAVFYKVRADHPILLAILLVLLANSNVHSAILSAIITLIWLSEGIQLDPKIKFKKVTGTFFICALILISGFLFCAYCVMPKGNSIIFPKSSSFSIEKVISNVLSTIIRPDQIIKSLLPDFFPFWSIIFFYYLAVLGLSKQPKLCLAAFFAQLGLGLLFYLVYPGSTGQQGLLLVFLIFLYWIAAEKQPRSALRPDLNGKIFSIGLLIGLVPLILGNVITIKDTYWNDIVSERSSSKAFAYFINNSPEFKNAILIPEPDYYSESLPYYMDNRIFFPRENRYGTTVSWTTAADKVLSIRKLLSEAKRIKIETGQPVLIVFGHLGFDPRIMTHKNYSYNKVFTWNDLEIEEFNQSTTLVTEFTTAVNNEIYKIYAVN
jgi:hypothetical protein